MKSLLQLLKEEDNLVMKVNEFGTNVQYHTQKMCSTESPYVYASEQNYRNKAMDKLDAALTELDRTRSELSKYLEELANCY